MKHKKIQQFSYTTLIAASAVIVAASVYVSSNWDSFKEISIQNPIWLIPTVILTFMSLFAVGMVMELAIKPHGINLSKFEIIGLSTLTKFGNYVSPGYLGMAIRAVYFKTKHGISFTKFSSSFLISNLVQLSTSGFIVLFLFLFIINDTGSSDIKVFIYLFLVFLLLISAIFTPLNKLSLLLSSSSNKLGKRIRELIIAYQKVRSGPGTLIWITIWSLVIVAVSSGLIYSLFKTIGVNVNLYQSIFIGAIGNWGIVFSITPGSIGIREGLMAFAAGVINVSIPATLVVAVILRIVTFIIISVLSLYFAPKLLGTSLAATFKIRKDNNLEIKTNE